MCTAPHLSPRVPAFTLGTLRLAGAWGPGIPPCPALPSPPRRSVPPPAPCLAAPLPCAAACTGLSGVNHVAKRPGCVLLAGGRREAACTGTNADTEGLFVVLWRAAGPAWASTPRGHPAHMGTARSWGLQALLPAAGAQGVFSGGWRGWGHTQGTRGWPQGAELSPHQPCPAGRSEMALLATIPVSPPRPQLPVVPGSGWGRGRWRCGAGCWALTTSRCC